MSKKYLYIAVVIVLTVGAIILIGRTEDNGGSVGEFWGTIIGQVSLGPTCPVVMDPPDSECADKPYATSLVLTTVNGARVIKTFSSDITGKFSVEAPPGEYSIHSAEAANVLPYCQSGPIELSVNDYVEVLVSCDTGIR